MLDGITEIRNSYWERRSEKARRISCFRDGHGMKAAADGPTVFRAARAEFAFPCCLIHL
jgi:hypothetical protein